MFLYEGYGSTKRDTNRLDCVSVCPLAASWAASSEWTCCSWLSLQANQIVMTHHPNSLKMLALKHRWSQINKTERPCWQVAVRSRRSSASCSSLDSIPRRLENFCCASVEASKEVHFWREDTIPAIPTRRDCWLNTWFMMAIGELRWLSKCVSRPSQSSKGWKVRENTSQTGSNPTSNWRRQSSNRLVQTCWNSASSWCHPATWSQTSVKLCEGVQKSEKCTSQ